MSDNKEQKTDYQSQQVFDSPEQSSSFQEHDIDAPTIQMAQEFKQQEFEPQDISSAHDSQQQELEAIFKSTPKKTNYLLKFGLIGLIPLALWELIDFLLQRLAQSPLLAAAYTLVISLLLLAAGRYAIKELLALKRLKGRESEQEQAQRLLDSHQVGQAVLYCKNLAKHTGVSEQAKSYQHWLASIDAAHNDQEILQLYSQVVLKKQDDLARKKLLRWSSEAGLMVALSPLAMVDMALFLWRNIKMIEELAGIYGIELRYWSKIKLFKMVLVNMLYAGSTELLSDVGVDILGVGITGKLSSRAAQGMGAGLLTARLGLKVMQLCRPIPLSQQEKQALVSLRKQLLINIKDKLLSLSMRNNKAE